MSRECYKEKNAWLAMGYIQMHEATGEDTYLAKAKALADGVEDKIMMGLAVSYLYQKTKEEEYLKAVEAGKEALISADMTEFPIMPFFMECETRYGKKEKYIAITDALTEEKKSLKNVTEICQYLAALIDTMDAMDFQIYELYRRLQDRLKETLKEILSKEGLSHTEQILVDYVILKACRKRVLLSEKYADIAFEGLKEICDGNAPETLFEAEPYFMMAYAQSLLLQKETA